jgi:hypothetical protein
MTPKTPNPQTRSPQEITVPPQYNNAHIVIPNRESETTPDLDRRRQIQPFPKPPAIERVETPDQRRRRELQTQTIDRQRTHLKRRLQQRLQAARERGDRKLVQQLCLEWQDLNL